MAKKFLLFIFLIFVFSSCGDEGLKKFASTDIDKMLGEQASAQYKDGLSNKILSETKHQDVYRIINSIKNKILNSGKIKNRDNFVWELKIIDDDSTLNAFCLPGGYIFVYTGLIKYLDNEAQLAGVLGHEIAHADNRHAIDNITSQLGLSVLLSIVFGSDNNQLISIAQNLAGLKFSRNNEEEADKLSINYLYNTDYDAREANGFFKKLESKKNAEELLEFLSTHPSPEKRYDKMLDEWKSLGGKAGKKYEEEYILLKKYLK